MNQSWAKMYLKSIDALVKSGHTNLKGVVQQVISHCHGIGHVKKVVS